MEPKKKIKITPAEELKLLHQISRITESALEFKEVLKEIIGLVSRLTHADACFLYIYESDRKELVLSCSKTPHPDVVGALRLKLGEGITGWVAQHNKPVTLAKEAHRDHRFKTLPGLPEDRYEAFLSLPVMAKGDLVGVINVQHRKPHEYTSGLVELITLIARHVGGTIEKSRLYDEAKRKARALETLAAVSHTIAQDRLPDDIMQMIVAMTATLMKSKICSVMLLDEEGRELKIVATQSLSPDYLNKPPILVRSSITGRAVINKTPVITPDVRTETRYQFRDLAKREGLVAMLTVPMMFKEKVLGVINTYTSEEHRFTQEEVHFLQAVANQCAAAIENTRLLTEKIAAQEALESRKLIERAKGVLMKDRGLNEQAAFKEIQKQSMDKRKSMKEIAEAVLLARELRG